MRAEHDIGSSRSRNPLARRWGFLGKRHGTGLPGRIDIADSSTFPAPINTGAAGVSTLAQFTEVPEEEICTPSKHFMGHIDTDDMNCPAARRQWNPAPLPRSTILSLAVFVPPHVGEHVTYRLVVKSIGSGTGSDGRPAAPSWSVVVGTCGRRADRLAPRPRRSVRIGDRRDRQDTRTGSAGPFDTDRSWQNLPWRPQSWSR